MTIPNFGVPQRAILYGLIENFPNWSNTTPFTYQDGLTNAKLVEGIVDYVNNYLVPYVDDEMKAVIEAWVTTVNALIDSIVNSSIELQDAVMAGILEDIESATRVMLNTILANYYTKSEADTKFPTKTSVYTKSESDSAFPAKADVYTKSEADTKFPTKASVYTKTEADTNFPTKSSVYTKTEADTNFPTKASVYTKTEADAAFPAKSSVYTKTESDSRFVLASPPQTTAVFIGSSNSTPGTWVEEFCTAMGFAPRNYSISGGAFTGSGGGKFSAQVATLLADGTLDRSKVSHVFICDMGNDIRATNSVATEAPGVFSALRTAFPKARIILVPAIWGNDLTGNNIPGRVASIGMRVEEAVNAGLPFGVELVDQSWTWLMDDGSWMQSGGGVHMNGAGYSRIADFMERWMKTGFSNYDLGAKYPTALAGITANNSYWQSRRVNGIVMLAGNIVIPSNLGVDQNLGQLGYGFWPVAGATFPVVRLSDRAVAGSVTVFGPGAAGGLIRTYSALTAGEYLINQSWSVI